MYRTTKDIQFPVSSFVNATQRAKNEVPQFLDLHNKMRSQNYRVTVQGPPVPISGTIQKIDYDEKKRDENLPLPQRFNQENVTG